MTRYVIIGAGIEGTTAAEEIRKRDETGEIVLIGEEEHTLYSRVLLPHYIKSKIPREKCFLKKETWYAEKQIEYLRGERVKEIDTKNKHVVLLKAGREIPYDKLLITTGGEPRGVEENPRGVSYLQTLDDADHLLQLLAEVAGNKEARAVVYGGGFIACEYLNIFKHFGLSTTCFFRGPWFWSRVLDEESGRLITETIEKNGVIVLSETTLKGVLGEQELAEIQTTRGEVRASILGVGVGLERDLSWITDAGIDIGSGVMTNAFLETNAPDVYSAGDIVEFEDAVTGKPMMGGNWTNALMQGRAVGKTMAGERTEYRLVTSYATNVFGLEIIFVGDTRRESSDEVVVRGERSSGYVVQLFLSKNRLIGATLIGGNADRMTIIKLIDQQIDLGLWREKLSNPGLSLKEIN
ncbi:MAG: NAD(P)H-nitrite reductase [Candidatus Giovannonibacteria bacterium GW2011_GWA2_53_7]|uniref:NAD(P)H-nitrite reductase n=1 Tax=Candidatus Giovannonibacteria bacterium GW2011_GWA2_53_7 TaxID=1618650 RepID=A0A0G1XZS0_9BACT|nr:MAG: NAD(P)H-nitrite reductase [Candidatus Giovannonibacteria bacterium GW2011_GWA2_53_7]